MTGSSQVGFIKGRSAVTNLGKALTVLNRVIINPLPSEQPIILALDAEKAFDNVKWAWLNQILDRMGLQGRFHTYLARVYSNPTAQVCTPGVLSPTFPLCKSTRQGCPCYSTLHWNRWLDIWRPHTHTRGYQWELRKWKLPFLQMTCFFTVHFFYCTSGRFKDLQNRKSVTSV